MEAMDLRIVECDGSLKKDLRVTARKAAKRPTGAGKGKGSKATGSKSRQATAMPLLLAGGNPQIAKADGDAPVQAYIAAMPGWKRDVGRRLDALIERTVPDVRKAVKWNSPFYGVEGQGWFRSFHSGIEVARLDPVAPAGSRRRISAHLRVVGFLPKEVLAATAARMSALNALASISSSS
jgi:hypothetical protein